MTVNVFEGARRVVRITAVLWVLAYCFVSLCFTSYLSKDGSMWMIPYGEDDTGNKYWLGAKVSPEVISYKARRISQFTSLKEYEEAADFKWWPGYLKGLWDRVCRTLLEACVGCFSWPE
jgi:hypothetical protein